MSKAKRYTPKNRPSLDYPKATLLYIFLAPLFLAVILALFNTNIKAFILSSISFMLFFTVARLARRGLDAENFYNNTTFTKAPKVPYKTIAGYLLGGATFFTAFITGGEPFIKSSFLAIIATLGYYLLYGFDPKKDKLENLGDISAEFVLETINEAKSKLSSIKNDMSDIKDTLLYDKLSTAVSKAKNILQTIQEDPKDIRVARKFLIVYIDGIAKVTEAYTDLDEQDITIQTKKKIHSLMDDVEIRFDKELARLKKNNQFDLDVHIDTLKEQIKH